MEKLEEASSWNKKRIFTALFFLVLLAVGAYLFKTRILGEKIDFSGAVKGASTVAVPPIPNFNLQKTFQQKLEGIKQEVQSLSIVDIASSSPQVQKALNDLKALEGYPKNEVKNLCQKICVSL